MESIRKAFAEQSLLMLLQKQFPLWSESDNFVLKEDDIIVLTKVNTVSNDGSSSAKETELNSLQQKNENEMKLENEGGANSREQFEFVIPNKKRKVSLHSESRGDADDKDLTATTSSKKAKNFSKSESKNDEKDVNQRNSNETVALILQRLNSIQPVSNSFKNTFEIYSLTKVCGKLMCSQYHGTIGMDGYPDREHSTREMTRNELCNMISNKQNDGFTRLDLMYVNARHIEYGKTQSNQPEAVMELIVYLIDKWFLLGIPTIPRVVEAEKLLERMKQDILKKKIPHPKYSNEFYELIPHQGDYRRFARFTTTKYCDGKLKYVRKMKSAIQSFIAAAKVRENNPLDHFVKHWLRVEFQLLEPENPEYVILNKVVENTKHPSQKFRLKNVFKLNNLNKKKRSAFSNQIYKNHRYLIHFSFASNLLCILREGLVPAPSHIHSVNRFLGDGIYFWDTIANAGLNYRSFNVVHILVCRVALGNMQQVEQRYLRHNETFEWDDGVDSIYCLGTHFNSSQLSQDLNGAKINCEKLSEIPAGYDSLWENRHDLYKKYVVRNKNQVRVDYILKLEREW